MDALDTKATKSSRIFKLRHLEQATNTERPNPLVYTIKGGKLILHNPVQFDLPFGGKYELSEIDLRKPIALAGGYACSQVESCVEFVKSVCASAPVQCGHSE
jgi:hypothetical protein